MVSAICPLCKIDLVEATNDSGNGLYIAEQTAATTLGAKYISNSWGGSEASSDTTLGLGVLRRVGRGLHGIRR
ncbi:MAG: Ig family protein [Actinomycetia bacterium]|nr:Ig family protein [Actinomycetes bacterium]